MLAPVETERKLNVYKTFRRRPGHLLNVLWTFNLRYVSTGALVTENLKRKLLNFYFNKIFMSFAIDTNTE